MTEISYPTPPDIVAGTIPAATVDREGELKSLARMLGFDRIFFVNQIHSGIVLHCENSRIGQDGDAAICRETGTLLGVFTADCVPVLVYGNGFIGFIHAGWRGFRENIFTHFFSSVPENPEALHAIIGPAICGDCYEIGPETAEFFQPPELSRKSDGSFHLNLPALAHHTLLTTGFLPENIFLSDECTHSGPMQLHSHRKDGTPLRNISFIGVKNGYISQDQR